MSKPPYCVPRMSDLAAIPWNGYTVASTFSGCGGSSLGYTLAGYRVLWASEFIAPAIETYRANFPRTPVDTRDIRKVSVADVLDAIGLRAGELDILDGSPPCASFSMAGKRSETWGQVKAYSNTTQRVDDLFWEYLRLVEGVRPRVFVAENVSGLVRGAAKGYFLRILDRMKACGYRVACQLVDAQWLGVPQMRLRTIFVGVRDDLARDPVHPTPLPYRYSVREALPWIERVSCLLPGKQNGMQSADKPCPTVTTGDTGGNGRHVVEVDLDIARTVYGPEWDKLGPGEASARYFNLIRADANQPSPTICARGGVNVASVAHPYEKRKFSIAELKRLCAFPDDFILTGTYAQQWERLGRAVPPLMMAAIASTIRDRILIPLAQEQRTA